MSEAVSVTCVEDQSEGYLAQALGMISGSRCVGCPVIAEKYTTPAAIIDEGFEWVKTPEAFTLTSLALTSEISPEKIPDTELAEEIKNKFACIFGVEPSLVVEYFDPLGEDSVETIAVELLNNFPDAIKNTGDQLLEELGERLQSCSGNGISVLCAIDE